MPGYPYERHADDEVFVTFHTVWIVPAAPSCESIETAAESSEQSGVDDVAGAAECLGAARVGAFGRVTWWFGAARAPAAKPRWELPWKALASANPPPAITATSGISSATTCI